jgi:tape measure domain-containing protein
LAGKNTVEIILAAKDQASRAVQQALGSVRSSASTAMGVISTGAVAAAGAMATLTGIIGKVGISYNAMQEQSQIAWETILGSQEEAKKTLQELQVMGAKTPFEFEGLDKAAKLLNMAGFEGDNLFKTLTSVGDAVSAVGGGQDELQGVSMAIFQMASKGKISAEEMNQLAERGIPAWQMMADSMGKTVPELMKMSEQGKLFAKDVLPELVDGMGKKFGGAMDKQSQTFNGMMSTLKDNLKMISAELTKGAFERLKVVLEGVMPVLDKFLSGLKADGLKGGLEAIFPPSVVSTITQVSDSIKFVTEGLKATYDMMLGTGNMSWFIDKFGMEKAVAINNFLWDLVDGFKVVKDGAVQYLGFVKDYWVSAFDTIKKLFSGDGNVGQSFVKIFETIKSIALPILEDAIQFIKDKLAMIKQFWDENGAQIIQAVMNLWSIIAGIFQAVAPVILFILKMLWENVKGVIDGALKIIMGVIKVFAGLLTGDFSKMWEGVKQLFVGAVQFLWNLINLMMVGKILGGIKSLATKGIELFKGFWTKSVEVFKSLDTQIVNIVSSAVTRVVGFFRNLFTQGSQIFGTLKTFGASTFQALWTAVKTVVSNMISGIINYYKTMFTGVKFIFEGLLNTTKTIFSKVKDFIQNPLKSINLVEIGKNIVGGLIKGISMMWGSIKEKVEDLASSLPTWMKKVLDIHSPSKETEEIGKNVSQGLAVGIEKDSKKAIAAAKKAAAETKKAFETDFRNLDYRIDAKKIGFDAAINELEKLKQRYKSVPNAVERVNKEIYALTQKHNKEIAEANAKRFEAEQALIDKKKYYGQISLSQELKIYQDYMAKYKAGTEQREYYEREAFRVKQEINDRLISLNEEYTQKISDANARMIEKEQQITNEYKSAVEERTKSLYNFAGLFDEITLKTDVSGQQLLKNLQSQVNTFRDWQSNMSKLASKGLTGDLLAELQGMGPSAASEIAALNTLSSVELQEYVNLWQEKNGLARSQSLTELQGMKDDTQAKILELRAQTKTELDLYKKEWVSKIAEIRTGSTDEFVKMKTTLKDIGVQSIKGLMNGMSSMEGPLMKQAQSIADAVKNTIKKSLDIHSPSRITQWMGRMLGEGLIKGMDQSAGAVQDASNLLSYAATPNIGFTAKPNTNSSFASPIQVILNYYGNGREEDAYRMVDIVEDTLAGRYKQGMIVSGVRS